MEERIIRFITALRAAGVRISLAESIDAFRAVDCLGVKDRETFRFSLKATLVKDASHIPTFEELFPIFFSGSAVVPMSNLSDDLSPPEAQMLSRALGKFSDQLRRMLEKLVKGEQLEGAELERLARLVGLNRVNGMRYREWMVQRLQRALHLKDVQNAVGDLAEILAQMGMDKERVARLYQLLQANQSALEDQLRQFAGQRLAENMSRQTADEGSDNLLGRSFSSLTEDDMERLRKEVQRLAAALKTRIALRQKRAKSGLLDAKSTIRANLKHGSVPIQIRHRKRALKPKLVVMCDVSTSMRSCSELMLSLLYALQDQISKTHSFAFIDHLEYISPYFAGRSAKEAVAQVLDRMPSGYYSTDLGNALKNFCQDYLNTIDGRTAFILVGDGRNNYNDPRLQLFQNIARRSRRTIWLTPEAPALWGSGDSDMLKYAPHCDDIMQAGNLTELTAAVDKLLQA